MEEEECFLQYNIEKLESRSFELKSKIIDLKKELNELKIDLEKESKEKLLQIITLKNIKKEYEQLKKN